MNSNQKINQYQNMKNYLKAFKQNELNLNQLINLLDELIESLKLCDQEWKNEFRSEWWDLEQLNAISQYHNNPIIISDNIEEIFNIIRRMDVLLDYALAES